MPLVRIEPATPRSQVEHSYFVTTEPLRLLYHIKFVMMHYTSKPLISGLLANSADPDDLVHHAAFHQDLHCLPIQNLLNMIVYSKNR